MGISDVSVEEYRGVSWVQRALIKMASERWQVRTVMADRSAAYNLYGGNGKVIYINKGRR